MQTDKQHSIFKLYWVWCAFLFFEKQINVALQPPVAQLQAWHGGAATVQFVMIFLPDTRRFDMK